MLRRQKQALSQSTTPFACTLYISAGKLGWVGVPLGRVAFPWSDTASDAELELKAIALMLTTVPEIMPIPSVTKRSPTDINQSALKLQRYSCECECEF